MKRSFTQAELKDYLSQVSREELEDIIWKLYQDSNLSQKILEMRFQSQNVSKTLLEEYKEDVRKAFFPSASSFKINTPAAGRIIEEYFKICPDLENQTELLYAILDAEMEIAGLGYMSSNFLSSILSTLDLLVERVNLLDDEKLYNKASKKLEEYQEITASLGWDARKAIGDKKAMLNHQSA